MAFAEYNFLLGNTPDMDSLIRAHIEHNEGVMYAKLFLFDRAAEMFLKAYEDGGNKESYIQYLSAVRMNLSNKEYISFIADNDEAYASSMEVEKRMKLAEEEFEEGSENNIISALSVYRDEGKSREYYDQISRITDDMKNRYRDLVKDKVK